MIDIPDARDAPPELAPGAQYFLTTGYRAITIMPMMRGDEAIGALSVVRAAPGPLSDKQIAILRTFADQALIAIENTHLLNELRQRTDDLSESLEQQTATSEVLKVISSSPGDLEPVFEAMLAECDAHLRGQIRLCSGMKTAHRFPRDLSETNRSTVPDDGCRTRQRCPLGQIWRCAVCLSSVPMLKDRPTGRSRSVIYRQEVRPFTDKQIELVENFAAQAVIAIENTRLLNELRQRTDDLSSRSAADRHRRRAQGHQPLDLRSAACLTRWSSRRRGCATPTGYHQSARGRPYPLRRDLRLLAASIAEYLQKLPASKPDRGSSFGRALLEGRTVHIPDVLLIRNSIVPSVKKGSDLRTASACRCCGRACPSACLLLIALEPCGLHRKQIELLRPSPTRR